MAPSTTRLAPSPTGALHLGNARTFLLNHLLAERLGWRVQMRVEDLDHPRVKTGSDRQALEELAWLGLRWNTPVVYQSDRTDRYAAALEHLRQAGWAYPCTCTRKDVEQAASAPHRDDGQLAYPGTCRDRWESAEHARRGTGREPAWRVRVDDEPIHFTDAFAGPQAIRLESSCGDFPIFKRDGSAAYQLAVVVDDADAGVDAIVRGDDLLDSTPRQIHLRRLLGLSPEPRYWHFPLVIGPDGRRLAKRHGDTRIDAYRQTGTPAERMLGLLGFWSGIVPERRPARMTELVERFDAARVPADPVVFSPADDRFLQGG